MSDSEVEAKPGNGLSDRARRRFLSSLLTAGAMLSIPGVLLYAAQTGDSGPPPSSDQASFPGERLGDQPVDDSVRWGLLVEADKCTACGACVEACDRLHHLPDTGRPAIDPQWLRIYKLEDPLSKRHINVPVMCQHCASPPCVDVCPTGASFKRADGIVLVDKHLCIGCRYCMMACPYGARSFIAYDTVDHTPYNPSGKGTVESCTLCVVRMDQEHIDGVNGTTACAAACEREGHRVLTYGDLKDPDSAISRRITELGAIRQLRADLTLDTGVRYYGL